MPLDPLSALAVKYGSDKWSAKHSYTAWYYEQFKDRRETVRKVVEIGVGEGASLRMWAEFFPNAEIWGADNDLQRLFHDGRIKVVYCDQSSPDDLVQLARVIGSDVDLFIDDGSHKPYEQIETCEYLMTKLGKGVVYVIEDVAFPAWAHTDRLNVIAPELDKRHRYDNRLAVVTHA